MFRFDAQNYIFSGKNTIVFLIPAHLREKIGCTCVLLPQGEVVTQDLAYFLLTLGMKMALRALQLPKVRGLRCGLGDDVGIGAVSVGSFGSGQGAEDYQYDESYNGYNHKEGYDSGCSVDEFLFAVYFLCLGWLVYLTEHTWFNSNRISIGLVIEESLTT